MAIFNLLIYFEVQSEENENASKPLAAYKIDGFWHVIDYKGNKIFPPVKLKNILGFSDGMLNVSKMIDGKQKWGLMNLKGEMVVQPKYDYLKLLYEGFALCYNLTRSSRNPVNYTFINKQGIEISEDKFIDETDFNDGLAFVMTRKKRSGYINKNAEFVIELSEGVGNSFSEGFAGVSNNDFHFGFINTKGELIIDYKYNTVGKFSEGLASVFFNGSFGYINPEDSMVINPKFDYAKEFKDDRAFVGISYSDVFKTRWGLIDKSGVFIVDYKFSRTWDFSEGTAAVQEIKNWGFIDKSGEYIMEPKYSYAASFIDKLAWASDKENKQYGFIDSEGNYIIELPKFDRAVDLRLNKRIY